ncbi:MAG TPA: MBL fold metallo-hydrolase [Chitinivibrionales bacterium]|nr:MBL fold metallo-hydrolase [Chitinivibrionales bacterium]
MYLRCWGSRGSLPVSGKQFDRYGGDTTCLEIRSKRGDVIVVDAGSGIRGLGLKLARSKVKKINLLFTHAHLDHIMGFPFFNPVYDRDIEITIHGCSFHFPSYREILKGVMSAPYFPVDLESVSAILRFSQAGSQPFTVGGITVRPIFLSHPNGGLGYRFEENGASFVFLTDNELEFNHPGGQTFEEYAAFSQDADLLIHDAEFSLGDYPRNRSYGHSVFSDAVKLGIRAGAKRLGLFHHNRHRTDAQIDAMVERSKGIVKKGGARMECFAVSNSFEMTL